MKFDSLTEKELEKIEQNLRTFYYDRNAGGDWSDTIRIVNKIRDKLGKDKWMK